MTDLETKLAAALKELLATGMKNENVSAALDALNEFDNASLRQPS
jgi:hypothetical protein